MSLYGFAACLAILAAFYLIVRRTIAKYAPSCPGCRKELFRNS
jgi:hypothetical protein